MSIQNEVEVLKIQVHNLKVALKKKNDQISKIKEDYNSELQKVKKEYGMKLLNLRITLSPETKTPENSVPVLCHILHSITGISTQEILSKSRKRDCIIPRYIVIYILRLEGKTLQYIAKVIGNQHHATIIHSVRTVNNWLEYPDFYRKEIEVYNKAKKMFEELKN